MKGRSFGDGGASSWVRIQTAAETANPLAERVSVPMELAGLEPATSWVRFRSAASPNPLQKRVSGFSPVQNPSDTPRLPWGFGDGTRSNPKTEGACTALVLRPLALAQQLAPLCALFATQFE
jgi:hypothetical protein